MNGDIIKKIEHSVMELKELHKLGGQELDELARIINTNTHIIRFKTERLRKEFKLIDVRLRIILYALASFTKMEYNYIITITNLIRTQEEQDDIYKDFPGYNTEPWKSVHQDNRGADVRNRDMTEEISKGVDEFLNFFVYTGKFKSRLSHSVGRGEHFHIQVDRDFITSINKDGED